CFCGKTSREFICGSAESGILNLDQYSPRSENTCGPEYVGKAFCCGVVCALELDCGHHTCQRSCHAGSCSPCVLTPERCFTCPCGQTELSKLVTQKGTERHAQIVYPPARTLVLAFTRSADILVRHYAITEIAHPVPLKLLSNAAVNVQLRC
ncbi:unnamed protein product, partial [Protopolystoma xenopodis]